MCKSSLGPRSEHSRVLMQETLPNNTWIIHRSPVSKELKKDESGSPVANQITVYMKNSLHEESIFVQKRARLLNQVFNVD